MHLHLRLPFRLDPDTFSALKSKDFTIFLAGQSAAMTGVWVQKLAVEAAVHADINLLYQAAMMDPLTGAVCTPGEIRQMVDEMLVAGEQWLPQYTKEISLAKKRMEGELLPYRPVIGFVLKEKTVEEMAEEKEKYREMASAAAKENVK